MKTAQQLGMTAPRRNDAQSGSQQQKTDEDGDDGQWAWHACRLCFEWWWHVQETYMQQLRVQSRLGENKHGHLIVVGTYHVAGVSVRVSASLSFMDGRVADDDGIRS